MIELPWSIDHGFYRVSYVSIRVLEAAWYIIGQSEAKWILVVSMVEFVSRIGWKIDKLVVILNFIDFVRYLLFIINT